MAGGVKKKSRAKAKRNKRSLDFGAGKRRASARDDKSGKRRASAHDNKPKRSVTGETPVPRSAEKTPGPRSKGELLYLYGISDKESNATRVEGVEAIKCGGLVCWVSRVDAKEYGEELQTRMENLDWLAGASVRHQRVVSAIHERITVLPARFATLFVSEESLSADVARRARQLHADLRRVAGADEYGVKIFGLPRAAEPVSGGSGREYLARKSQLLRQSTPVTITPEVEKFVGELQRLAQDSTTGGSVSGGQKNLVWQGSLLVARVQRKGLEQALADFHRRQGGEFRIECTGPWPPYSFIAARSEAKSE